jgi:hypothetical protein
MKDDPQEGGQSQLNPGHPMCITGQWVYIYIYICKKERQIFVRTLSFFLSDSSANYKEKRYTKITMQ